MAKDPSAEPRKLGIYDILALLATCAWLAILFFLYKERLEVHFLIRVLTIVPLALAGGAVCFLFLWRPLPKEDPNTVSHEDFGVALRAKKIASLYITVPLLNRTARKEIVPAAITAGVLFLLGITPLGPFRSVLVTYPDPSVLVARDICRPILFLAGDSLAVMAPPALSPETESWEKVIPAKTAAMRIYRLIFQGKYQEAVEQATIALGAGGADADDPLVKRARAQALFLLRDYENALKELTDLPGKTPEIQLQMAVANLHLGQLDAAEEMLAGGAVKVTHEDFYSPEFITEHLQLLVFTLRGKDLRKTGEKLGQLWHSQREAYIRSLYPEDAGEDAEVGTDAKKPDASLSLEEAIRMAESRKKEISDQQRRVARRLKADFVTINNNHVVHLALAAGYAGAYREAELTKYLLKEDFSDGTQRLTHLATASAWNTQGVMLACFEKHMPGDSAENAAVEEKPTDTKAAKKPENARLAESILKDSPYPLDCFQEAEAALGKLSEPNNAMLPAIVQSNRLQYYVRSEFATPSIPTAEKFAEIAEPLLAGIRGISQEQRDWLESGYGTEMVPTWILATQISLMDYYIRVDGREKNAEVLLETVIRVAPKKLGAGSLMELDARARFIESRTLNRFAKNSKLGSLKETESMLQRTLTAAKKELPAEHPVMARLYVSSARMALLRKVSEPAKKARPAIMDAMKIQEALELPERNQERYLARATDYLIQSLQLMEEKEHLTETGSPEEAVAKENTLQAEMKAFQTRIAADYGQNSLLAAMWMRDCGFLLTEKADTANATRAYEKAYEIYLAIFGEKSLHTSLTTMGTFLKDRKPVKPAARSTKQ